jgi:hypothetical protein
MLGVFNCCRTTKPTVAFSGCRGTKHAVAAGGGFASRHVVILSGFNRLLAVHHHPHTACSCPLDSLYCRSPGARKNWRSAFVFDEPEAPGSDPVATLTSFDSWPMGLQGLKTNRASPTAAPAVPGSLSGPGGPGVGGPGSLFGPSGPGVGGPGVGDVLPGLQGGRLLQLNNMQGQGQSQSTQPSWESDYGMYAQLLAPGSTGHAVRAAGAADAADASRVGVAAAAAARSAASVSGSIGSTLPSFGLVGDGSGSSVGTHVLAGGGGVVVSLAGAHSSGAGGMIGSAKQPGYGVGAMRELSLVALGGGGVLVQRLEAYEMANMWDAQEGGLEGGEEGG